MPTHRSPQGQTIQAHEPGDLRAWSLPSLSHDRMVELGRELRAASRSGDLERSQAIRETMVRHNLGLVGGIVKRFPTTGVEKQDLMGYGVLGLLRAIDRWDPESGNRFSTYAVPAITNGILRMITNESHTVRVPAHAAKLFGTAREFFGEHGRAPTAEELAKAGGASLAMAKDVLATPRHFDSLTTPDGGPREDLAAPFTQGELHDRVRSVADELAQLAPDTATLVRYVYGFSITPQAKLTPDELAVLRGVTRRTVLAQARRGVDELRARVRAA